MTLNRRFRCCLVGGTFDRLHAGHRLLLDAACSDAERVEVHITSDEIAQAKSSFVQSYQDRMDGLLNWAEHHASAKLTVHVLTDAYGPARSHDFADAIVGTPETIGMCHTINEQRENNGLQPLHVIEVQHLESIEGGIISSSAIRNGSIDPEGHPWITKEQRNATLAMVASVNDELKTPMGELFEGPEDDPEVGMSAALDGLPEPHGIIVAVGDVTTKTLLDMGYTPDIALIDGQTKRTELDDEFKVDTNLFQNRIRAVNPAGVLTASLNQAIEQALHSDQTVVIEVEGEEDLAPLHIHCHAPLGTVVMYGQPKTGVVVQITSIDVKQRCRNLISMFEVKK